MSRRIDHKSGSQGEMSPVTAELKCPHGGGKDFNERVAVTGVSGYEFGGGRKDHLSPSSWRAYFYSKSILDKCKNIR